MAYVQREGGERFVIRAYRAVLAKRKGRLKEDILNLSSQYGEYVSFQRRGLAQFEAAFSRDPGYLFGECVWFYFKNPKDLIYCEAVPDTTEAYLVIVKDGAVYLDGVFPVESIPEELLVFTTQKNNFEIYVYGDVPISQDSVAGKFSFDPSLVKEFTVLDAPLFERLPTVKAYQLQLVDVVLRQQGIGVFPVKYVIAFAVIVGLAWMGYSFMTMELKKLPKASVSLAPPPNPYLQFNKTLISPAPGAEIRAVMAVFSRMLTLPGWIITDMSYQDGKMTMNVKSLGANTASLIEWAHDNQVNMQLTSMGFVLTAPVSALPPRPLPAQIYPLDMVVSSLIDRVALVLPGNVIQFMPPADKKAYKESSITIKLTEVSPETVILLSEQFSEMPLTLTSMSMQLNHGLTGTIVLQALGS